MKIVRSSDQNRTAVDDNNNNDKIDSKIPAQAWMLYIINIMATIGFTTFTSIFALYVIDLYDLTTISVGYITLCTAVMSAVGNLAFIPISKYLGMYTVTLIACLWFSIALIIAPFMDNLWALLAFIVFGVGGGYGQILAAMNACTAEWTNITNRGIVLGLASVANNIGLIIGPTVHGILYGINKSYPFYLSGVCVFIAGLIIIVMLIKWPELKMSGIRKKEEKDKEEEEKNWKYAPEKITKRDYMRLGKAFGVMLSDRKYMWKAHFSEAMELFNIMFPEIRSDSVINTQHDIQWIINNAKQVRMEYDDLITSFTTINNI